MGSGIHQAPGSKGLRVWGSAFRVSSWEVPALERLAGIQSKPVLKKALRV